MADSTLSVTDNEVTCMYYNFHIKYLRMSMSTSHGNRAIA